MKAWCTMVPWDLTSKAEITRLHTSFTGSRSHCETSIYGMDGENARKEERRGKPSRSQVEGVIQNAPKKSSVISVTPYAVEIAASFGFVVGVEIFTWGC